MTTQSQPALRQLDERTNDGLRVQLFWVEGTKRCEVRVEEAGALTVQFSVPGDQARVAFVHPFAFAVSVAVAS